MDCDDLALSMFRAMSVDQIPTRTYLVSPDGRFLSWSPLLSKMLGVEAESELGSRKITDFYVDSRERQKLLDKLNLAENHGRWLEDEIIALRVGSQIKYVRDYCRSVRDPETNVIAGYVGCLIDVTDEGVYSLLSKQLGIAIFAVDLNNQILFVNDSMVSLFGYPNKEAMLNVLTQEIFVSKKTASELRNKVCEEKEITEFISEMKSFDGKRWAGSITAALDPTRTHYACRVSDVTMDQQYRQMLDEMPVGTFMYRDTGDDHTLVRCNDYYAMMLGFSEKETIIGQPIGFTHADRTKLPDYLLELDKIGHLEGYDVRLHTTQDKQLDAKVWVKKLSGVGQIKGRVGVVIDISEETALRRRIAELTQNIGQILHTYSQTLYSIRLKTKFDLPPINRTC